MTVRWFWPVVFIVLVLSIAVLVLDIPKADKRYLNDAAGGSSREPQ